MSRQDQESPSSNKRGRYTRQSSSDNLSIEELLLDDMGYDADIEVIKPDQYEEVESESEGTASPHNRWSNVDEELAARMRQLGREQLAPLRSSSNRGRKRMSIEMTAEDALLGSPLAADLEVQEVVDTASLPSPAKRRRKKSRKPNSARHAFRGQGGMWTDSSERAERNNGNHLQDGSTSTTTSERTRSKRAEDDEMMDMT